MSKGVIERKKEISKRCYKAIEILGCLNKGTDKVEPNHVLRSVR